MKIRKIVRLISFAACINLGLMTVANASVSAGAKEVHHDVVKETSKVATDVTTVTSDVKTKRETKHHSSDVSSQSPAGTKKTNAQEQVNSVNATHASMKTSQASLANAISSNFNSWVGTNASTGKPNTELTTTDIEKQLKNPDISGQEAAALAAIAVRTNGMTAWQPQSLASINQKLAKHGLDNAFPNASYSEPTTKTWDGITITLTPKKGSDPVEYTTTVSYSLKQLQSDINQKNSALYNRYKETLNNLRGSFYTDGRINLYGGKRTALPPVSAIRQGAEGDCYFVSSVEALLNSNPAILQGMIQHVSGNTYTVTFPGQAPITVTPTRSEVAMFSYVEGGGGWLAVLAVAAEKSLKDSTNIVNIIHGGLPYQVLSVLTGKPYKPVSLTGSSKGPDASTAQVESMLSTAFSTSPVTPIGVEVSDHALSIVNYTPANPNSNPPTVAMVTIQNPWGTNGKYVTPNGTPLTMTNNGQITIPVSDLAKDGFVAITVPTSMMPS